MNLINLLKESCSDINKKFLFNNISSISLNDVLNQDMTHLDHIKNGSVVSLIGDFDALSISTLINLIDKNCIVVPLTKDTKIMHKYFFENSSSEYCIEDMRCVSLDYKRNALVQKLRNENKPGIILFSTGTTGRPKAILHDFTNFIKRYKTKRAPLRTINFLLFDHIGGINTLFHTIINNGEVFVPDARTPIGIANEIKKNNIQLLPTTPSFLRMMLIEKIFDTNLLDSLELITYGTEKMDLNTLKNIAERTGCNIRQTYGMSELGIFKVLTKQKDDLWIRIVGDGVETKIENEVLKIKSDIRMNGYLNADSPFDSDGWYDTGDIVESDGDWIKIVGRNKQIISTGGLKILPSEVENAILNISGIKGVKVCGEDNPILGQHILAVIELDEASKLNKRDIKKTLKHFLPDYAIPHKIKFEKIKYNHRFKKS
jgi:acyl-CoA synthetase (AMP-forming)/AMP-acid ligase II